MKLPRYSHDAGIYIHVPFCRSKCTYCGFYSIVDFSLKDSFIEALTKEFELRSQIVKDRVFKTIYIGGGTPSTLDPPDFLKIFDSLRKNYKIADNAEITVEVNPESVSEDLIKILISEGVNRISMGVQSAVERELRLLGRIHDLKTAERAVKLIQDQGIENINVDLIFGIPGQSVSDFEKSLEWAIKQDVKHISTYSLTLERGTELHRLVKVGKLKMPDETGVIELYRVRDKVLKNHGFVRYEISNFSRPGYECKHNLIYWYHGEYIGFGPSAASFLYESPPVRFQNRRSLKLYVEHLLNGNLPPGDSEALDRKSLLLERIFLYIRTIRGLPCEFAEFVFNLREDLKRFFEGNHYRVLNFEGMLLADHLALEIFQTIEEMAEKIDLDCKISGEVPPSFEGGTDFHMSCFIATLQACWIGSQTGESLGV